MDALSLYSIVRYRHTSQSSSLSPLSASTSLVQPRQSGAFSLLRTGWGRDCGCAIVVRDPLSCASARLRSRSSYVAFVSLL